MVAVKVYHDIVIAKDWNVDDALGILQFVLVLMVASIPVAMPAVFSITMALGALALSKGTGDRFQALGDRGNGRCRYPLLGQDRHPDQEPVEPQRADALRRHRSAGLHPGGGAGVQARGQGRHRYRGDHRAQGPDACSRTGR
jgi:hypothetical protein